MIEKTYNYIINKNKELCTTPATQYTFIFFTQLGVIFYQFYREIFDKTCGTRWLTNLGN